MLERLRSFSSPNFSSIIEFKYCLEHDLQEWGHSSWPKIEYSSTMVEDWVYNDSEEKPIWLSVRTYLIDYTSLACSKFLDGFLSSSEQNSFRNSMVGFATNSSFTIECD